MTIASIQNAKLLMESRWDSMNHFPAGFNRRHFTSSAGVVLDSCSHETVELREERTPLHTM